MVNRRIWQWTGFAVSLVAALMSGLATAFNVYATSIKETFRYTQSEVELIASLGLAGVGFCILQPIVTSRFGYQVAYAIVLIVAPVSCLLVYVATRYLEFFSQWPILIGLFLLLANMSSNMFQLQIYQIGVNNFDKKYSGKIIGLYSGLVGLGKVFFCGLYEIFFYENLGGFFLTVAILWAVNVILCMVLHRPIPQNNEMIPLSKPIDTGADPDANKVIAETNRNSGESQRGSADISEEERSEVDEAGASRSVKDMAKSLYFHLMLWSSVVFYSAFFTFLNNLTTIGESAGMKDSLAPVYCMSMTIVLARISVVPIYDTCPSDRNSFIVLFFTYLCYAIAMVVGLTCFNPSGMYVMTFLVGVSVAGGDTLPWALLSSHFGRHNLSRIIAGFYFLSFCVVLLMQMFIGFFYDREISSAGSTSLYCHGAHCFRNSFLLLLSVVIVTFVVQLLNCFTLHRKGKQP